MWHSPLSAFFRASPWKPLVFAGIALAGIPPVEAALPKTVTFRDFFNLSFDRPLLLLEFPEQDSTYLVVQQSGGMRVVRHESEGWVTSRFDSISVGGVNGPGGDDGGLLGFAFHPDYVHNGKYYVYYVASYTVLAKPGKIMWEERVADSTRLRGSAAPARLLLTLTKPFIYHNGGTLKFGADGYLYTAIGDGGFTSTADPMNRAQNKGVLFGKMLRVDVDGPDAFPDDPTRNYAVPADNPFVDSAGAGYLPEIFAIGLRSPWKWTFHPKTGMIWLGDIGHNSYEDLSVVPRGGNMGWKVWEAAHCFETTACSSAGMTAPVLELGNPQSAIMGGEFFMGDTTSAYHGVYFFGDHITNTVWALREIDGVVIEYVEIGKVNKIVSFNKDRRGRVFAVGMSSTSATVITGGNGTIYVLESPDMRLAPAAPTAVAGRAAARGPALSRPDLEKNPGRYQVFGLDGREVAKPGTGVFRVREKGRPTPPRLLFLN